ncbi:hypothetical protein DLAC_02983 [Tieghemostelium lacteum]|uniref:Ankyrin repeat-containing protein n=1 Tax=Tieghemostelium lacteum TaxID=361077 RepID=A0A152A3X8_TIELA|nr:hypothetical protein DLAC_02983 [Tieghemostelium lacteum]|eukprot:KYR00919.1 hypothetical protein DLAC_02983 [Tieghemostelium lacteum]
MFELLNFKCLSELPISIKNGDRMDLVIGWDLKNHENSLQLVPSTIHCDFEFIIRTNNENIKLLKYKKIIKENHLILNDLCFQKISNYNNISVSNNNSENFKIEIICQFKNSLEILAKYQTNNISMDCTKTIRIKRYGNQSTIPQKKCRVIKELDFEFINTLAVDNITHLKEMEIMYIFSEFRFLENNGNNLLHMAIELKSLCCTRYLLEKYPDLVVSQDCSKLSPFHLIIMLRDDNLFSIMQEFLETLDDQQKVIILSQQDCYGMNILHWSTALRFKVAINKILQLSTKIPMFLETIVNSKDLQNQTPIHKCNSHNEILDIYRLHNCVN